MKRRKFIQLTGSMALLSGGSSTLFTACHDGMGDMGDMMNMGKAPGVVEGTFYTALPVPPSVSANGAKLTAQQTTAAVFKRKTSTVLGYQPGGILGSTLRATTGLPLPS